jgi:hypothetical protein
MIDSVELVFTGRRRQGCPCWARGCSSCARPRRPGRAAVGRCGCATEAAAGPTPGHPGVPNEAMIRVVAIIQARSCYRGGFADRLLCFHQRLPGCLRDRLHRVVPRRSPGAPQAAAEGDRAARGRCAKGKQLLRQFDVTPGGGRCARTLPSPAGSGLHCRSVVRCPISCRTTRSRPGSPAAGPLRGG